MFSLRVQFYCILCSFLSLLMKVNCFVFCIDPSLTANRCRRSVANAHRVDFESLFGVVTGDALVYTTDGSEIGGLTW